MRIGINGSSLIALNRPVSEIIDHAVEAERDGFASYWVAQLAVPDALTVLGAVGRETSTIELGTAVIATWLRHPLMLARRRSRCPTWLRAGWRWASVWRTSADRGAAAHPVCLRNTWRYLAVLLPALGDRAVGDPGEIWSGFAGRWAVRRTCPRRQCCSRRWGRGCSRSPGDGGREHPVAQRARTIRDAHASHG
jgi:hypothetical protein